MKPTRRTRTIEIDQSTFALLDKLLDLGGVRNLPPTKSKYLACLLVDIAEYELGLATNYETKKQLTEIIYDTKQYLGHQYTFIQPTVTKV